MSAGYLIAYKDDTWRGEMGRYTFTNMAGFSSWPDSQNDRLSPFKFNFYDIGNITAPVALVFLGDCWLVLVANWNAARLDFYTSNSPDLRDSMTRFSASPLWSGSKATHGLGTGSIDSNWGAYRNINLFNQAGTTPRLDDLWFVGMHTDRFPSMEDWADLYHVKLGAGGPVVTKKSEKRFYNSGGGQRFLYASGFYYDITVKAFEVYSAEAHISDGAASRIDRWL